jgi:hypothetical protein
MGRLAVKASMLRLFIPSPAIAAFFPCRVFSASYAAIQIKVKFALPRTNCETMQKMLRRIQAEKEINV